MRCRWPIYLQPHVVHDPLTGHLQRPRLRELQHERPEQNEEVSDGNSIDAAKVAVRDVAIDRQLHQVRLGELKHRARDDRRQRQRNLRLVGPQVGQQPTHQPGVVGFTEDFFFVEGHESQLPATSSQLPALSGSTPSTCRYPFASALTGCHANFHPGLGSEAEAGSWKLEALLSSQPTPLPAAAAYTETRTVRRAPRVRRGFRARPPVRAPGQKSDPNRGPSRPDARR